MSEKIGVAFARFHCVFPSCQNSAHARNSLCVGHLIDERKRGERIRSECLSKHNITLLQLTRGYNSLECVACRREFVARSKAETHLNRKEIAALIERAPSSVNWISNPRQRRAGA